MKNALVYILIMCSCLPSLMAKEQSVCYKFRLTEQAATPKGRINTDSLQVYFEQHAIYIDSKHCVPIELWMEGQSKNSIIIQSKSPSTLRLKEASIFSDYRTPLQIRGGYDVKLYCEKRTTNTLANGDTVSNCLLCEGDLTLLGEGTLNLRTNGRNAIHAKKDLCIGISNLNLECKSDRSRCVLVDKDCRIEDGAIIVSMNGNASKGFVVRGCFSMINGNLSANANGDILIRKGKVDYSTILKVDSTATLSGGIIQMKHTGLGGKGIQAKYLHLNGGEILADMNSEGTEILTQHQEHDYVTSKCIMATRSMVISRGRIVCNSYGSGGKGILSGGTMTIGQLGDEFIDENKLFIKVSTGGTSLVNDVVNDKRFGCPKSIKSLGNMTIYSGNIYVTTLGMGGEGLECGDTLRCYKTQIDCRTFDDGINVTKSLEIDGAHVYCCSEDNDAIDSNGRIVIHDGVIVTFNQDISNEGLDAERGEVYIYGGHIFSIGGGKIRFQQCTNPFFLYRRQPPYYKDGKLMGYISMHKNRFVSVCDNGQPIMTVHNPVEREQSTIFITSPMFEDGKSYQLNEGLRPTNYDQSFLNEELFFGGEQEAALVETIEFGHDIKERGNRVYIKQQ